jgi:hypothetical protein
VLAVPDDGGHTTNAELRDNEERAATDARESFMLQTRQITIQTLMGILEGQLCRLSNGMFYVYQNASCDVLEQPIFRKCVRAFQHFMHVEDSKESFSPEHCRIND